MSAQAFSAPTVVTIKANFVSPSCTVDTTKDVDFQNIDASALITKDAVSPAAGLPFTINITGCSGTTKNVDMKFSGTASTGNTKYYANAGTAKNIAIRIKDDVTSTDVGNGVTLTTPVSATTHTGAISFKSWVANDTASAATPGTIQATVVATMTYK